MSSTVSFGCWLGVIILRNKLNHSTEFVHLKWTLSHLRNSVLINFHNKFNLKSYLHSNRLMPPSRSGLLVKFSAATAFSGVAQGSQLFWPFCKQSNPSRFQPQRACGPWQPGHLRESLPWPDHLVGDLQGGGGGQGSAAWVSLSWGNAVAFINCNGSCKKKKKQKTKNQNPKKPETKSKTTPFPPPILLRGMNLHCS